MGRGLEVRQLNTVSQCWGRGGEARLLNVYMYMCRGGSGDGLRGHASQWIHVSHNTGGRGRESSLLNGRMSRVV